MSIQPFNGDTAVAFVDVSGFKRMMRNRDRAMATLAQFYQEGYQTLREHRRENGMSVEGLFVTDCGILFVRRQEQNAIQIVEALLLAVEALNRRLFAHEIKTTTSIAFGFFRYNPLNEYEGLEKNYIFGDAYVDAFQDNESTPKPDPGVCRILRKNFQDLNPNTIVGHPIWSRCRVNEKHISFFWMCETAAGIEDVERRYQEANQSRFEIIDNTLQTCSLTWNVRAEQR
jgi:hypothetical protein